MKWYRFCSGRFDKYINKSIIKNDYEFIDSFSMLIDFIVVKVDMILDGIDIRVTYQIFPEKCLYRTTYEISVDKRESLIFFSEDTFMNYVESLFKYYDNSGIVDQIKEKETETGLNAWKSVLHRLTPSELQHSKFDKDQLSLEIYPLGIKIDRDGEYKTEVRWSISDLSDQPKRNTIVFNSNLDLLLKEYEENTQR